MNVCLETFGCRLNRAEALECEAQCAALGHRIVKRHSDADLFIVRGCSVTARAQRDCEKLIAHLKRHYPNRQIIVTGCLPDARKDIVLPVSHKAARPNQTAVPKRTARAYLKAQDGCAGTCTFCIVPRYRGKSVSTPFEQVLARASRFIEAGYHEIVLTGCNLALYADGGHYLCDLVAALAALDPSCRVRLGSLEPWGSAEETIAAMAEHANVCRFLHLPVQSGSDRILEAMGRPYRVADVERIVATAERLMPDLGLGCDLMTGFPGETEGEFAKTRLLLSRLAFTNAHLFPFSERPGTAATRLPGIIQHHVRHERVHTLETVAKSNRARFAKRFLGREVEVVVESSHRLEGWTGEYLWFEGPASPTLAAANKFHQRRKLMRFVVRTVDGDRLHGVPVG